MPACYSRNFLFFPFPFCARLANICRLVLSASFSHPRNSRMFVPGYPVNYCFLAFSTRRHWRGFGTPGEQAANRTLPLTAPYFLPIAVQFMLISRRPTVTRTGSSRFDCGPARESAPNRWPYVPEAPISISQLINCS
ncbi:hypothetical protein TRIATDRAFT_299156 [Trichoderma atroviride IMI 206040]|uniref:Uncharacterized protein n=1 Tax=Hypocrea atroviridis (strain ATCC 20476 / IMI 206040) TaxID=452589 RepID=G9NRB3_HYPAI|nr:uncharacterized protein TRIATDRAFT_299156 [Trichoderma atroviride IMI 206040]EHK46548.1 hypothetical protein TRIATDRAFT_299156 [Trichoderma atroviride IMI 206040]